MSPRIAHDYSNKASSIEGCEVWNLFGRPLNISPDISTLYNEAGHPITFGPRLLRNN
jgi:hypothetical protein